ncbi:ATP-binding cassette domain-containing protein [Pediococcus ethanolidurans]|uniref:ATP-binding cassette domain-containing protein n=1 Tax=Pediococcus ethanolidurans TaxID=319653 RepID=UPI001C1E9120|nr:ATP-binding cassette domain-containing protein [Pediococcus ethanolidurans]MBU7563814.1 ATP-binding cassette domain-containing protein [Pediococcus ethanolidurans]MCT4397432.1 ATP-binding cassette domain-containing protein [Pediococcus ethanolidurans]MCV3321454.1 ATP-binding cassette domain-containing protein [Pediococcus ethanolidurans]MCV3323429.1 ATP-binding cassette domain-containing protein [Pediococcus ethanolidurans]
MNQEYVIQVNNLKKQFGRKVAVRNVSFEIKKGEIFGLLGPNGAGKTTILRMMTTLLSQDAGNVLLNGFDTLTQSRLARQQFSITGQTAAIDQDLTARENLMIFGKLNGLTHTAAKARAAELLTDFDLTQSADQTLVTFSGGMRRRLDLAISLIGKPAILFLDEPTTGLDPRTRMQMWQAIQKLVAEGSTVLLTTQYLEEADHLADRIALIDHGKLVAMGTPNDLKQQIGGMQLRIEVTNLQEQQPAKKLIQDTLALPVSVNDRTLTVLLDHTKMRKVSQILGQLQDAAIAINNFAVETPPLDDVFLKLTVGKN